MEASGQQFYKVKLQTGRILGPLDLERVRLLILKNQIVGVETARPYPQGDWRDINQIPEIAELILSHVQGKLSRQGLPEGESSYQPIGAGPIYAGVLPGATQVIPVNTSSLQPLPELATVSKAGQSEIPEAPAEEEGGKTMVVTPDLRREMSGEKAAKLDEGPALDLGDEERTRVATAEDKGVGAIALENQVLVDSTGPEAEGGSPIQPEGGGAVDIEVPDVFQRKVSQERTVIFQRSTVAGSAAAAIPSQYREKLRKLGPLLAVVGIAAYVLMGDPPPPMPTKWVPVRPKLPAYVEGKADPKRSLQLYGEAMKFYVADTVQGYKRAADILLQSAGQDITNVKSLAMLASCYLNLIDSSNKDENYFMVISKLIELSRAKALDLPETIIADVEFYATVNKAEAAQNRIVEYTKTHKNFDMVMFFYVSFAFYERGDLQSAARYIAQIPDNKAYSPRVFFLRGKIAERLNDPETALKEYEKAYRKSKDHLRSRLRIADILAKRGALREAAPHLEMIVSNPTNLPPKELALAYYLHAQVNQLYQKWDLALGDVERAVKLDKDNHDYLLELFTLRAKAGDSIHTVQKEARMYFFLSEGEKLHRLGKYQDALTQFLQGRQANPESPLPALKIGDMFTQLNDQGNALMNYRIAAKNAPNSIEVWSKYINALIQSYEWEEAQKAMDKFRNLPVSQSAIDKAAGDMYARQGQHAEAQIYYKKAMSRDTIDTDVYVAYAKSLMAAKNFRDAPFFFALALRFDPTNIEAIVGTSKCVAATEGIDRGISMLQDELQKSGGSKAEMLTAIAEFQLQKGDWGVAQQYVDQAMAANPDFALPWKLQAQIHLNREGLDRDALDRALAAYKSYSERNLSDPSGYLERYRIFTKKTEFEAASEELSKIFALYPKYPNLHYYKGALYSAMGNHKAAADAFKLELTNNPNAISTIIALGKEYVELGAIKEAQVLFNKAMQMQPTNPEAKHWAGWVAYLMKNYAAAVALFNSALMYDKGNAMIYKRKGITCRDMGDPACAKGAFQLYLEMDPEAPDKAEFEKYL